MKMETKELFITHLFDASIEVVFSAWTEVEQLKPAKQITTVAF